MEELFISITLCLHSIIHLLLVLKIAPQMKAKAVHFISRKDFQFQYLIHNSQDFRHIKMDHFYTVNQAN